MLVDELLESLSYDNEIKSFYDGPYFKYLNELNFNDDFFNIIKKRKEILNLRQIITNNNLKKQNKTLQSFRCQYPEQVHSHLHQQQIIDCDSFEVDPNFNKSQQDTTIPDPIKASQMILNYQEQIMINNTQQNQHFSKYQLKSVSNESERSNIDLNQWGKETMNDSLLQINQIYDYFQQPAFINRDVNKINKDYDSSQQQYQKPSINQHTPQINQSYDLCQQSFMNQNLQHNQHYNQCQLHSVYNDPEGVNENVKSWEKKVTNDCSDQINQTYDRCQQPVFINQYAQQNNKTYDQCLQQPLINQDEKNINKTYYQYQQCQSSSKNQDILQNYKVCDQYLQQSSIKQNSEEINQYFNHYLLHNSQISGTYQQQYQTSSINQDVQEINKRSDQYKIQFVSFDTERTNETFKTQQETTKNNNMDKIIPYYDRYQQYITPPNDKNILQNYHPHGQYIQKPMFNDSEEINGIFKSVQEKIANNYQEQNHQVYGQYKHQLPSMNLNRE